MSSMPAFSFTTVPSLVSEPDAASCLGQLVAERFPGVRRVLIVTDSGLSHSGLVNAPRLGLEQQGMQVAVFADLVADPPDAIVHTALEFACEHGSELVIGPGAGSSIVSPSSSPSASTARKRCNRSLASARSAATAAR